MKIYFIIFTIFMAGCVTNSKIDPSLVIPWSEQLSKEEPYEYPFKAIYKYGSKRLIYIASLHESNSSSPTFKMVEDTFKQNKIDLVIVEGLGEALGISPSNMVKWASTQGAHGFYTGFETAYSIVQASQRNKSL